MRFLDGVRGDASLAELQKTERILLVCLTVLGAALRVFYQHDRPFTGDEVGTLVYMQESPAHILSNFDTWLTMNYFILLEKGVAHAFGSSPWVLTALPLAASVCAIPLTVALALQLCSRRAALIAGALTAMNACHVEYGPVIRSNSLMVALTLATVILFLRWRAQPTTGRAAACATAATALCIFHPVAIYVWAGIGLLAACSWVARVRAGRAARVAAELRALGLPFAVAGGVLVLAYARLYPDIRSLSVRLGEPPPISLEYVPLVFGSYFARGFAGLPALLFLMLATWSAIRGLQPVLVPWLLALVPVCAMSWQGVAPPPWGYERYLIFTLPFLIILVAEGIDVASRVLEEPRRAWLGWGLALLVVLSWIPALESRFERKSHMPWTRVARFLAGLPPETAIVAASIRDNWELQPLEIESGRKVLTLPELLERDESTGPGGLAFVYVNSHEPIRTDADSVQFGNIQAITYGGGTLRDLVTRLHADLVRTTRESTGAEQGWRAAGGRRRLTLGNFAEFEPIYASLVESSEYLGLRKDAERFRLLRGWSHQYKLRSQAELGSVDPEIDRDP